ncbi:MAG: sulfatase-like hydrolase/transferase [Planctomycetota bacterium]
MTAETTGQRKRLLELAWFAVAIAIACVAFNAIEYGRLASGRTLAAVYHSRGLFEATVYLGTYVVSAGAIVAALFSRITVVRWLALALVFVFLALDLCCRWVTGENVGFSQVHMAFSELSFVGEFFSSYGASVGKAVLIAALVAAAFFALVHFIRLRLHPAWLGLVPLSAVLIYAVLWKTVAFTDVYPSALRIPVLAAYVSMNSLYVGPRRPVGLTARRSDRPRVLVLIVDESIRGDYLGINGFAKDTTPFLASISDQYLNFGIACSATNISSGTNIVLQSGLRADECPDRAQLALKQTSIFQYAQAAGYRTCFLDGQSAPGNLSNFMTQDDFDHIDVFYQVTADEQEQGQKHRRDQLLALRILELTAEGDPVYIYVNKYGAHFHYENTYPPGQRRFEPTMHPQKPIDASSREEIENSYANSILWNVDRFFELLLPALDLSETVVLYTSDHGQSFKERRGVSTHADRRNPPASQANVPLIAWGGFLEQRLPDGASALRDRTGHFRLFPSQLILMGYEEAEVTGRYGTPLWAAPPEGRIFVSGDLFGRGIMQINDFDETGGP